MNKKIPKKDSAIALIMSLFFLIILFAIGVTLLFRANLNKKTATALSNADLSKNALEGVINNVASNISYLNYDSGSNSLGTSLVYEGKLKKIDMPGTTEPAYTLASQSTTTTNTAASNFNSVLTKQLFKFTYGNVDINEGSNTLDPNNELNIAWQITGPKGDETNIEVGDKVYRYAYLLIDQSGKIDPNFTISSDTALANGGVMAYNTENYGVHWDVLNDFAAEKSDTRYDLINLLTKHPQDRAKFYDGNVFTDLESMYEKNERILDYSWDQNEYYSTFFRKADNSANIQYSNDYIVHNFFYPYSSGVTYKEKEVFNLKSIEDGSLFSSLSSTGTQLNEDKIQTVIDNIPYLQYFPSEEYEDPTTWTSVADFKPTAQREQIAASMIDYIDDDIVATHNYVLGETINEWLTRTGNKPVCGFEGFFVENIFFTFKGGGTRPKGGDNVDDFDASDIYTQPSQWTSNADIPWRYQGVTTQFGDNLEGNQAWFQVMPRIFTCYDLRGKNVRTLTGATMMLYTEFNIDCTVTKTDRNLDTGGGNVVTTFNYQRRGIEAVVPINGVANKGAAQTSNTGHTHFHKPGKNNAWMWKGGNKAWQFGQNTTGWVYSPYPEENGSDGGAAAANNFGADTATIEEQVKKGISYAVSDITITFTKPFILFQEDDAFQDNDGDGLDDDSDGDGKPEHSMPQEDEIVQIFMLPQSGTINDTTIGRLNSCAVFFANVVDPRLSHLPSSYRALEKLAGTKVAAPTATSGDSPNWQTNNYWALLPTWQVWKWLDPSHPQYGSWWHTAGRVGLATHGEEDYKLSGFPTESDSKFTYPMFDGEVIFKANTITDEATATDHSIVLNSNNVEGPDDLKFMSTIDMPVKLNGSNQVIGFGGITNLAEIGKLSRGEPWRSFNMTQINMKLYKALVDAQADGSVTTTEADNLATLYKYANNYDDPIDSSKTLDDFPFIFIPPSSNFDDDFQTNYSINDLNGGDAILLEQLAVGPVDASNPAILTMPEREVFGTFNPNTPYPFLMKTLLSSIKIPRKNGQTVATVSDITGTEALVPWKLNSIISSYNIDAQKLLADNNGDGFADGGLSPFSRKYSYSSTEFDVGASGYKEDFNLEYDENQQKYKIKDLRTGSVRYGNIFAKQDLPFLTDLEREFLYANSKEFISTRFNYFSAILLVEPLTVVPNNVTGSNNVKQITSSLKGSIEGHYRIRAELAHDTLTNHVTILDYKILN